jgi:AcrR family transcriptional regulator
MKTRGELIAAWSEMARKTGTPPNSIPRFCSRLEIEEGDFFRLFPSMQAVERAFWREQIERVVQSVKDGGEYEGFDARQRFLTVVFAFLEDSLSYRSLLLMRFQNSSACRAKELARFDETIRAFVSEILEQGRETGEIAERGRVSRLYPEGFVLLFHRIIHFHLQDESEGYERTDAFVEKSVKFAFDVISTQAIDSAIDLARFLVPAGRA